MLISVLMMAQWICHWASFGFWSGRLVCLAASSLLGGVINQARESASGRGLISRRLIEKTRSPWMLRPEVGQSEVLRAQQQST